MTLHQPLFWNHSTLNKSARCLLPFTIITRLINRHKRLTPPKKVTVPVICCGNITVGGTGKTPVALNLARQLQERGMVVHFLTRGYKGRKKTPYLVSLETDTAYDVGDEALLLARIAPTWCGADRYKTAQKAIAHGATCLIMDDGLQNNTLYKDFSFLIINGHSGLGNRSLLPAGPLREDIETTQKNIHAIIMIGHDHHQSTSLFSPIIPVLNADYIPKLDIQFLKTKRIIAFAGIGHPERFFHMLENFGLKISRSISYPDHHHYTDKNIKQLTHLAKTNSSTLLVTTSKDAVKLPHSLLKHIYIVEIDVFYKNRDQINIILNDFIKRKKVNNHE